MRKVSTDRRGKILKILPRGPTPVAAAAVAPQPDKTGLLPGYPARLTCGPEAWPRSNAGGGRGTAHIKRDCCPAIPRG